MFTAGEVALWSPDDALQELRACLPAGWKLTVRHDAGYSVAELHDEHGSRTWLGSNVDPKLLYLDGIGWLMTRNHRPTHPAWRPREREIALRVPNPESHDPDPPDLDPKEVAAVYKNRR